MTKKLKLTLVVIALLITTIFGTALYADENENTTKDTKTNTIPDFIDVPKDFWGYADIMEMVQMGYLKGKGDGKFDPNGQVTYAEFLTMIANMFYEVEGYPNITNKHWYYDNVRWLAERGITQYFWHAEKDWQGYLYTTPTMNGSDYLMGTKAAMPYYNRPISRNNMALAMYNLAFNSIGQVRTLTKPEVIIYDREGMSGQLLSKKYPTRNSAFMQYVIQYSYKNNLLRGINAKGDLGGDRYMTRAEAATVLKRLYHASVERVQPTAFKDILVEKHNVNKFGSRSADYDILAVYRPNKLTNGKTDTHENRTELLKEIMLSMPDGKEWADTLNFPGYESAWFNDTIGYGHGGCNGYAAFINTALFGQFAPMRAHHDIHNSVVGDVWLDIGADDVQYHYDVILEKVQDGIYKTTSGNAGGRVSWGWNEMLAPQALVHQFPKSEIYVLDEHAY